MPINSYKSLSAKDKMNQKKGKKKGGKSAEHCQFKRLANQRPANLTASKTAIKKLLENCSFD
jgi:hypothetical protein